MKEETVETEDRKPAWSGSRLSSHAKMAAVEVNNRGEMKLDKFRLAVSSDISGAWTEACQVRIVHQVHLLLGGLLTTPCCIHLSTGMAW